MAKLAAVEEDSVQTTVGTRQDTEEWGMNRQQEGC